MKLKLAPFDVKQKLNRRETIIFMATLLVAFLGFFRACVTPNQAAINEAKQQIQTLEIERSQLSIKKSHLVKGKHWVGTQETINQSIDALARPIRLLSVRIVSMELSDTQKKDAPFYKKSIVLTLSGNFPAIGQYIEGLESLPVPLFIESLSVAPDGNQPSRVTVRIQGGFYASN